MNILAKVGVDSLRFSPFRYGFSKIYIYTRISKNVTREINYFIFNAGILNTYNKQFYIVIRVHPLVVKCILFLVYKITNMNNTVL